MEVTPILTRQQLHRHAMLIAAVFLLLIAVSASVFVRYGLAQSGHSLVTRVIKVQPTSNGLAKVTVLGSQTIETGPDWSQAGSETALSLSLQ